MISRNSSGILTPKINVDNHCTSLSQKDKIIALLEKQLQEFRNLRQNYDRLKDRKHQLHDKCELLNRQINIGRGNQDTKVDNTHKTVAQLRMLVCSLEKQLQNKQYQLKDLKTQSQNLIKSSQQRQNDFLEFNDAIDSIKTSMDILGMETDRILCQIDQTKDEIGKIQQFQKQTQSANQKVKSQIHNTQSFIRKLNFQESKLSENLSVLEDQNNSIDQIIQDLNKVHEVTKMKYRELRDDREQVLMKIKTKQLQKGRVLTEHSERLKQFKAEKEKQKILKEATQSKKSQIQRLSQMLRQVNDQNDELLKRNLQFQDYNIKLRNDLTTCRKHLQNVSRNNQNVKSELQTFYKTNLSAIKKLRKPIDQGWIELNGKKQLEAMQTNDGFLERSV